MANGATWAGISRQGAFYARSAKRVPNSFYLARAVKTAPVSVTAELPFQPQVPEIVYKKF
jgi:hypothetical protein